jgi:hypothetical protein
MSVNNALDVEIATLEKEIRKKDLQTRLLTNYIEQNTLAQNNANIWANAKKKENNKTTGEVGAVKAPAPAAKTPQTSGENADTCCGCCSTFFVLYVLSCISCLCFFAHAIFFAFFVFGFYGGVQISNEKVGFPVLVFDSLAGLLLSILCFGGYSVDDNTLVASAVRLFGTSIADLASVWEKAENLLRKLGISLTIPSASLANLGSGFSEPLSLHPATFKNRALRMATRSSGFIGLITGLFATALLGKVVSDQIKKAAKKKLESSNSTLHEALLTVGSQTATTRSPNGDGGGDDTNSEGTA